MDTRVIINDACYPSNRMEWRKWRELLGRAGIEIMDDDSGFDANAVIDGLQARQGALRCTIRYHHPPEQTIADWTKEYEELLRNPPQPGDELVTRDGSPARLTLELQKGREPFIYGLAYVPAIVGEELGWFLAGMEDAISFGFKVVMMPKAKQEIIMRRGLGSPNIPVKRLKVVKIADSKLSLLGEVAEY